MVAPCPAGTCATRPKRYMKPNFVRNTRRRAVSSFVAAAFAFTALTAFAQEKERPIPRLVKKDGRYALFVDGAPYFILGAQVNNSSGWPAMLPKVWEAMEYLHANTVEIPVYWEQFEPKRGSSTIAWSIPC